MVPFPVTVHLKKGQDHTTMLTIKSQKAYQPSTPRRKQENKVVSRTDQIRKMNIKEASLQGYFVVVVINKLCIPMTMRCSDQSHRKRTRNKGLMLRNDRYPKMNEHIIEFKAQSFS